MNSFTGNASVCIARSPTVLPPEVQQFSLGISPRLSREDDELFGALELPDELVHAVPKRQLQFRAGRFCALEAMRALDPRCGVNRLARGRSGAPRWPDGVTGSITHTENFAWAAVAWTVDAIALGIDSEPIMSEARGQRVLTTVSSPSELSVVITAGFTRVEALTLVFSAKETVFKCLHPHVGRMFGYLDVRIVNVDAGARTFLAQIVTSLSRPFSAGATLEGRFELDDRAVHTGMLLRPDRHR